MQVCVHVISIRPQLDHTLKDPHCPIHICLGELVLRPPPSWRIWPSSSRRCDSQGNLCDREFENILEAVNNGGLALLQWRALVGLLACALFALVGNALTNSYLTHGRTKTLPELLIRMTE